jgi:DNA helicase-2/ATP-dependent DNA helicase PcrA
LNGIGLKYSDLSMLLRKRRFGSELAKALDGKKIPYIIEGVNELFITPECIAAKNIFDYLNKTISRNELIEAWKRIRYPIKDKYLEKLGFTMIYPIGYKHIE